MPRTLWRYILIEQWRLLLLTSAVLVVVIAFAATIKPLADGKLTAGQAVMFMLYAVPPMLAYALPFAAGFGTTLAYHRLANDRELLACHAGGLSHLSVLTPAIISGVLMAGVLAGLNDQVIPRFLRSMERMITQDLADVMLREMAEGESATLDTMEIHADAIASRPLEADSPYDAQYLLRGVAAVEADDAGNIVSEVFARQAWVMLLSASSLPSSVRGDLEADTRVVIVHFEGADAFQDGTRVQGEAFTTPPYPLASAFEDDPKFRTNRQLTRLLDEPKAITPVASRHKDLARHVASVRVVEILRRRIESEGSLRFDLGGPRGVRIEASGLTYRRDAGVWALEPSRATGRIEVEETLAGGGVSRGSAARGVLRPQSPTRQGAFGTQRREAGLVFELVLQDVLVTNAAGDARLTTTTEIPEQKYEGLVIPGDPIAELTALSPEELMAVAATEAERTPRIARAIESLDDRIEKLRREVLSKKHERYAMAASCLVMMLTGAVTAIKLRESLSLVVYLWSFIPALLTIVLISAGQGMTARSGAPGLVVLWLGVVLLLVYTLVAFRSIARH